MSYATLAQVKNELKATSTTDDALALLYADLATARIDSLMGQGFDVHYFEPFYEERVFGIARWRVNSLQRLFRVDGPMLALDTVKVYNTTLTIDTDVRAYPANITPFKTLQLIDAGANWYSTYYDADEEPLVRISAYWGFHRRYSAAWQNEDALQADISASATSLAVADADGANWRNQTPRFSAGNLVKVESEYMRVLATDTTTNTLTVRRGENGTVAAAHSNGAAVAVFYPEDNIARACARQAAMLYARRGAFDSPLGQFGGAANYPNDLLAELRGALQGYVYT